MPRPPKNPQAKTWGIVIPCEWPSAKAIVLSAKALSKKWYWIEHDRDFYDGGEIKKPHIHLLMTFASARSLTTVRNYFAEFPELLENSFEKINNAHGSIRYLAHADNPEKFQYLPMEIETNDALLDNYFINPMSGLQEQVLIKQVLRSSAVGVTFDEWVLPIDRVLESLRTSHQRLHINALYYGIWERKRIPRDPYPRT